MAQHENIYRYLSFDTLSEYKITEGDNIPVVGV